MNSASIVPNLALIATVSLVSAARSTWSAARSLVMAWRSIHHDTPSAAITVNRNKSRMENFIPAFYQRTKKPR